MAGSGNNGVYWGDALVQPAGEGGTGGFVERDGELYYRIANYHRMPPFFMTVVSGFDHWMFVSSNGGLTCGRRSPDFALFPYTTDDKIHDADNTTGPQTVLLVERAGKNYLWKPFSRAVPVYRIECNLYKNRSGNRLIFEEANRDLGLVFSYCWAAGDRFGFIRKSSLRNVGGKAVRVRVLDGLRNLMPSGVDRALQTSMSTLVDAYKQAESHPESGAAIFTLSSIPSDRAEPCEALKATVAWSVGLDHPTLLLSEGQVGGFCAGAEVTGETFRRGQRGAFFVEASLAIAPEASRDWYLVADVEQGPAQLPALLGSVEQGVTAEALEQDIESGTRRLLQLANAAGGCQHSSDLLVATRHFSNTLFNIMRGGTFHDGYRIPVADFLDFVGSWNRPLRAKFAEQLAAQGGALDRIDLLAAARGSGAADMERLALEYLPLTFSRRHGDPSRPWNHFSIDIRNADGSSRLDYQGNWRDIFQNWEALAISYPEYIEGFVAKFVNASTVDGYNPFRVSRAGFEWEVMDPDDPWSNIGYWGDHQVNYLVRLLELSRRYHPGALGALFQREVFVYANVPYRLKVYSESVRDPRNTVEFDHDAAAAIASRVEEIGSDGKLATQSDGSMCRVNLLEKLVLPALVKIGNLAPGGGIWMNTQRPEWNDANNALVGYGLSMVTLCYLRRYLLLLTDLLAEDSAERYAVSAELFDFFGDLATDLSEHRGLLKAAVNAADRKRFMDQVGASAEAYRASVYAGLSGRKCDLGKADLQSFIRLALEFLDHSIAGSRREDGLFHSYNLIHFSDRGYVLDRLPEMLEGQVAVLSSGYLDPQQSLDLLDALRASRLYRSDQDSFMLYPDRNLPLFLDKNVIAPELVGRSARIKAELVAGRKRYVARDIDGRVHFSPEFRNVGELRAVLQGDATVAAAEADALCEVYEASFGHRQFTGRSGSMYKYEGLGCIYWHMVSKLALAVGEVTLEAAQTGAGMELVEGMFKHFRRIQEGLGLHKTPAHYGAFPIDPYSHTPGFAGVQQPGMTGQVKEDIITRFLELGVRVDAGEIRFTPVILRREEFLSGPETWTRWAGDRERQEQLEAGQLAFSLCGVPVVYQLGETATVRVYHGSDQPEVIPGVGLGREWSRALCERDGRILRVEVDVPAAVLR